MPDRPPPTIAVPPDLRDFTLRVLVVLAVVALALFAWRIREVLLLVFGAALVATLLRGLSDPVARHSPLSQGLALALVALVLGGSLAALIGFFGSELRQQAGELARRVPQGWQTAQDRIGASDLGTMVLEQLKASVPGPGNVLTGVAGFAAGLGAALTDLLLVTFGGLYLAAQPRLYRRGLLALLPDGARERASRVLSASGSALQRWLVGQLLAMAVVGTMTAVGLQLLGVPTPLALGLLAALLEFVPVIGPIMAAVPAVLVAATVGVETAMWTAVLAAGIQQVENHALVPLIGRRTVALPPALTLFAIVAAGLALGLLGLLVAAPLTVVLYVAVAELWVRDTLGREADVPGAPADGPPPPARDRIAGPAAAPGAHAPVRDPAPSVPPAREPPAPFPPVGEPPDPAPAPPRRDPPAPGHPPGPAGHSHPA